MSRLPKNRRKWLFAGGSCVVVAFIGMLTAYVLIWWSNYALATGSQSVALADDLLKRLKSEKALDEFPPNHERSLDADYASILSAWDNYMASLVIGDQYRSWIGQVANQVRDGDLNYDSPPVGLDWREMDGLFENFAIFANKLRGKKVSISRGMPRNINWDDVAQLGRERQFFVCLAIRSRLIESQNPDLSQKFQLAGLLVIQRRSSGANWMEGAVIANIRAAVVVSALSSSVCNTSAGTELAKLGLEARLAGYPTPLGRLAGEVERHRDLVEESLRIDYSATQIIRFAKSLQGLCAAVEEWRANLPKVQERMYSIPILIELLDKHCPRGSGWRMESPHHLLSEEAYWSALEQLGWMALEVLAEGRSECSNDVKTMFGPGWSAKIWIGLSGQTRQCSITLTGDKFIRMANRSKYPVEWAFPTP